MILRSRRSKSHGVPTSSVYLVFAIIIVASNIVQSIPIFDQLFDTFFSSSSKAGSRRLPPLPKWSNDDYFRQYGDTRVWITVDPVVDPTVDDPIINSVEIHWRRAADNPPKDGDYLALYSTTNISRPIFRYLLDTNSSNQTNYIRTNFSFPYLNLTQESNSSIIPPLSLNGSDEFSLVGCLHYYLVYFDAAQQKTVAANCVRLNRNWMKDNLDAIKNRKLTEILIPGTHDASSFEQYGDDYEADLITRFQYTQDDSIYNQLTYGIRYLDFRIGAYNVSDDGIGVSNIPLDRTDSADQSNSSVRYTYHEELWMVHDIERNHLNLTTALRQVRRFLQETTHEIVIVDFHRFVSGFADSNDDLPSVRRRLELFQKAIVEELGSFLIPYSHNRMTYGELMRDPSRRVVLGYAYKGDTRVGVDSALFWPAVSHLWAQTDELAKLEQYIDENVCKSAPFMVGANSPLADFNRLRSVMAELTPTIQGVLMLKYHGLRELAELVNIHYDSWFRQRWWKCSNIVAADFFLGSDIVQIAIDVNRRRANEL